MKLRQHTTRISCDLAAQAANTLYALDHFAYETALLAEAIGSMLERGETDKAQKLADLLADSAHGATALNGYNLAESVAGCVPVQTLSGSRLPWEKEGKA